MGFDDLVMLSRERKVYAKEEGSGFTHHSCIKEYYGDRATISMASINSIISIVLIGII